MRSIFLIKQDGLMVIKSINVYKVHDNINPAKSPV